MGSNCHGSLPGRAFGCSCRTVNHHTPVPIHNDIASTRNRYLAFLEGSSFGTNLKKSLAYPLHIRGKTLTRPQSGTKRLASDEACQLQERQHECAYGDGDHICSRARLRASDSKRFSGVVRIRFWLPRTIRHRSNAARDVPLALHIAACFVAEMLV